MRWFNRYNFPYSNFHDLNLDWIIREMNRLIEEWEVLKAEWEQMKIDWADFQAEMQRLWKEYKDLMNAAWEAYKAQMNQEWADYKDEMDAAWDAYQAELNAQWTAYQNNLNAAWLAYQNAMNTWKDGVDQDIQNKFNEIDEKCRQCKADVDAAIATLNGLLASVQQQVTDYLNNLDYEPIIKDATNEWLDEHGVTIPTTFLTPEEFGAVGDGTTDDKSAFIKLLSASSTQHKPISLSPNATYFLSSHNWQLPQDIVIYGNGATILFDGQGSDAVLYVNAHNVIRDLRVIGRGIYSYSGSIDGLYLENIYTNNMDLSMNGGSANNVHLKSIEVLKKFQFGGGLASNYSGKDFVIEDLILNEENASITGNGFIRGIRTNCDLPPVTVSILSYGPGIIFESYDRITINKYALSGEYKVAQYTTV